MKQSYLQCVKVFCSATFRTTESIDEVIRPPAETQAPTPVSAATPAPVTRFMCESGDTVTRLDRTEPTLNEAAPGDERDTSTPERMSAGLHTLLATPLLTPSHRTMLENWMREDKVADNLLRTALPKRWAIADKTSAGRYGSRAIIAAVYPVGEPPVYMAIYITQTDAEMKVSDGVIKGIGERVFR